MSRKVLNTIYLDQEQVDRIEKVCFETRLPKSVIVREGVDLVLAKYEGNGRKKKPKK